MELEKQGFLLVFLVLWGSRGIISSWLFCYSTYMYILFFVLLKSIYGGTLIDLVSVCYLEWKCSLFFAEEVVFYGILRQQIFYLLTYML